MTRVRKGLHTIARWLCTSSVLVLVALAVLSGWFEANFEVSERTELGLSRGRFDVNVWPPPPPKQTEFVVPVWPLPAAAFQFGRLRIDRVLASWGPRWMWKPSIVRPGEYRVVDWLVVIPLWIPAAPTALFAGLLWRTHLRNRRRLRNGLCPSCGYDLRGHMGVGGVAGVAPCPECGAKPG